MRYLLLTTCIGAALAASSASGNEQLQKMSQNPKDWVMPTGNYANTRYSELSRSRRLTSASFKRLGPFRPAYCAATKADL